MSRRYLSDKEVWQVKELVDRTSLSAVTLALSEVAEDASRRAKTEHIASRSFDERLSISRRLYSFATLLIRLSKKMEKEGL